MTFSDRGAITTPSAPTQRETALINHSWLVDNPLAGVKVGGDPKVSTTRDFVEVMNHRTGSVDLYIANAFGRELVATKNSKDAGWTSQIKSTSSLTGEQRKALIAELKPGSAFNRKLDDRLLNTASQDFKGGLSDAIKIYGKSVNLKENPRAPGTDSNPGDAGGEKGGGGGGGGGSDIKFSEEESKQARNFISQTIKARTKYGENLQYPITYDGNDFTFIEMIRYVPETNLGLGASPNAPADDKSPLLGGTIRRIGERSLKESAIATIKLPIPSNLVDSNPVDWQQKDMDVIQAYGAGAIGRIFSDSNLGAGFGREVRNVGGVIEKQGDAIRPMINAALISKIIGLGKNDLITRSSGAVINANTELLFQGPQLRTFQFNFKMTPRNQKESDTVRKIIRTLKQGMSIKRSAGGIFLASPNVFRIKFMYVPPETDERNREISAGAPTLHPYLPVLKVCALSNLSVNYTPDGSYMTYGDGSMVSYEMTLSLSEIDPIFDEDYDDLEKTDQKKSDGNSKYNTDSLIGY